MSTSRGYHQAKVSTLSYKKCLLNIKTFNPVIYNTPFLGGRVMSWRWMSRDVVCRLQVGTGQGRALRPSGRACSSGAGLRWNAAVLDRYRWGLCVLVGDRHSRLCVSMCVSESV